VPGHIDYDDDHDNDNDNDNGKPIHLQSLSPSTTPI
jgi:hypothetical protein